MCGRYVTRDQAAIERYFNISSHQFQLTDRYNVAPTTTVPVVRSIDGERVMSGMHWGLIPFWSKDKKIAYKTINARAETVASKPAFRSAYKARRCLIPASGFYEWKRDVDPKIPHFIHKRDNDPLAFAGLWETWKDAGDTLESCTIVTTKANDMMAELHNRMPVILDAQDFDYGHRRLDRSNKDDRQPNAWFASHASRRAHCFRKMVRAAQQRRSSCIDLTAFMGNLQNFERAN